MSGLDIFDERRGAAQKRITQLRLGLSEKLDRIPAEDKHPALSIYATGSLARLEASQEYDLDAFFMLSGSADKQPNGRIRDVRILNCVLEVAEASGFPDFSNEGEYLRFLHIESVLAHIGSREDDYINAFTARMLLLLESAYLYNEQQYYLMKDRVVDVYFTDFHRHSEDFRPIFLINDILRFWRTLCLNYENGRQWRDRSNPHAPAKGYLDNLKLKFSRLNICFSFICHLLSQGTGLSKGHVMKTSSLAPFDRLKAVAALSSISAENIARMGEEYAWFLQLTAKPKEEMLTWIADERNRAEAFGRASSFVTSTVGLTKHIATENNYLDYLIV